MQKGLIMKNNKLIKIGMWIFSLAAIIGVSFGITAFAENSESQSVEIAGYNVSYGGSVSIVYAVKSELNDGQYVKIKGSAYNPVDGTTENFSRINYEIPTYDIVINGENFGKLPMFYTPGIPLKNMATVVTAEAVICNADGTETDITSGKVTYSVLEYLYQRQFMYAESNTPAQNELYELMLKTGEAVQAALNNYGADHTPSKYAYFNISGGSFDGKDAGIVLKGNAITLTGNDAGFTVTPVSLGDGYAVEKGTPVTVANGGEYTVEESVIVTANGAEAFEFGAGRYYSGVYAGLRYDFSDESQMNKTESGGTTDDISITDGIERFGKTAAGAQEYIFWNYATSNQKKYYLGDSLVFEADLKFSGIITANGAFSKLMFRGFNTKYQYSISLAESDGKIRIGSSTYVDKEQWNNIAIVVTPDASAPGASVDIYVNGVKTATEQLTGVEGSSSSLGKAHLYLNDAETGCVYIDNVYTGYVRKNEGGLYYNSELSGKRYDFTDGNAAPMFNSNPASESTVVDGVNVVKVVGASSADYPQFVFGNQDTSSFTNTNKCAVFETDIMFNDAWTQKPQFAFRVMGYEFTIACDLWKGNAMYVLSSSNGICMYVNRWYNLRFEIYETDTAGKFNVQIYLNGAYKLTTTLNGNAKSANDMLFRLKETGTGSAVYFDNMFFDYVDKAYETK